jgi:anthraniloyl-CoA monooxygenase
VLLGDALHTAHFSIGSGTKLAMEDSIALAEKLAFRARRARGARRVRARAQARHRRVSAGRHESRLWFENARDYVRLPPARLAYSLMTRSNRVTHESLRRATPSS